MKKRVLSLLLALALLCALLPQTAPRAAAEPVYSGSCGDNLSWTFDPDSGTLSIEGSGQMQDYSSDTAVPWYSHRASVTALSLPEGLSSIGRNAFRYCTRLTSVSIPETVASIGESAFYSCRKLSEVTILGALSLIDASAFHSCSALSTLRFSQSVQRISNYAFHGCSALTALDLPEGLTTMGPYAFGGCSALQTVHFPNTLSQISTGAFALCTGLTELTIPDSVTRVESWTFNRCSQLSSVTLPANLTSIEEGAFFQCGLVSLVLPDGVTKIGASAFKGCASLRSISIPDTVSEIGNRAFQGCAALSAVALPENLTIINPCTFLDCTALTTVTIPENTAQIGFDAFLGCSSLEKLIVCGSGLLVHHYSLHWYGPPEDADESEVGFGDEICYPNTLGVPGQTVIYGRHDPALVNSPETCCYFTEDPSQYVLYHDWALYWEDYLSHYGYSFAALDPFQDIPAGAYYELPAAWAYADGITSGTGAGHFSPNQACTREQVVTLLWRAKGSPEPGLTDNRFADVKQTAYYYKAVLWAVENGVTVGVAPTRFGVGQSCTRAEAVSFLWAAAGRPEPTSTENPFADVQTTDYDYKAVLWAVENGVTAGTGPTAFSPAQTCTRAQIVSFLFSAEN